MRTIITAVIAAVVIATGAFAATAVVGGQATAQESDEPAVEQQDRRHKGVAVLEETLSELVEAGTITQEQSDAITDALAAKAEQYQADRQERREQRQAFRELFRAAMEDDVIDSDELAELQAALPDGHWLNDPDSPAAPYLEDGELTKDELEELRDELHRTRPDRNSDASAAPAEPTGAQI